MTCRICDRVWDRIWAQTDSWERTASSETAPHPDESGRNRNLIERAGEIAEADPATSFRLYLEAAEGGSVWAMVCVGWHYWSGNGVAADPYAALEYYHRAIAGGSWMDTIYYARLLAELERHDDCERILNEGVALGFVPAYFWLGWTRCQRSNDPRVRTKVRPLMEHAADNGHPTAKLFLARWMALGHLRRRDVPRGWVLLVRAVAWYVRRE